MNQNPRGSHLSPTSQVYRIWFLAAVLVFTIAASKTGQMYRYHNVEGNTVIGYQVPVEYAGAGYEVLNDEGMVIAVVPRALTDVERKAKNAEEKLAAAAIAEQERLREWDESLLLRYSTEEDITAARDRALRELQIRLSILKGNRRSLKQTVENYQSQAADLERRGMTVGVERLRSIELLQAEIGSTDRAVVDRQKDIEEISNAFELDIERFEMLQEVVVLRRTLRLERELRTREKKEQAEARAKQAANSPQRKR